MFHKLSKADLIALNFSCDVVRAALATHATGCFGGTHAARAKMIFDTDKSSEIYHLILHNQFEKLFVSPTWIARIKDAHNLNGIQHGRLTEHLALIDKFLPTPAPVIGMTERDNYLSAFVEKIYA